MKICKKTIKITFKIVSSLFFALSLYHHKLLYLNLFFFSEKKWRKIIRKDDIETGFLFSQCYVFLPHPFTSLINIPFSSIKRNYRVLTKQYLLCPNNLNKLQILLTESVWIVSGSDDPSTLKLVHMPIKVTFGFFRFILTAQRTESKRTAKILL